MPHVIVHRVFQELYFSFVSTTANAVEIKIARMKFIVRKLKGEEATKDLSGLVKEAAVVELLDICFCRI